MVAKLDKEQLVESYKRTGTLDGVAEEFGVSRPTVIKYMNRYGIERKKYWPKKFHVTKKELEDAYQSLGSAVRVAEKYGVSKKLVLNYMSKYGIKRNKRPTIKGRMDKFRELVRSGKTAKEIGEVLGMHPDTLKRLARKHGLSIRDPYHKGFSLSHNGYKLIPAKGHPNADVKGYIREHRKVVSDVLGRPLEPDEVVHHINENKLDNRKENLEVMSRSEHARHHRAKSIKI